MRRETPQRALSAKAAKEKAGKQYTPLTTLWRIKNRLLLRLTLYSMQADIPALHKTPQRTTKPTPRAIGTTTKKLGYPLTATLTRELLSSQLRQVKQ